MNVRIVSTGRSQHVVIVVCVCNLLADVDHAIADQSVSISVYQAVDKRRGRVLIDLLNPAAEMVSRLSPIVVLHGDDENGLHFLRSGSQTEDRHKREDTKNAE